MSSTAPARARYRADVARRRRPDHRNRRAHEPFRVPTAMIDAVTGVRARTGIHRHARAFRPAAAHRSRTLPEDQPGRDHRGDRPGRHLIRADRRRRAWLDPRQIAGWNGNPSDLDFSWRSVAEYLDRLDQGITPNAAYLVPQGTLRLLAVGADQRPATPAEITHMQELLAQGMSEGAVGMSSGLTYTPGMYADTAELAALCRWSPSSAGSTHRTPGPTAPVRSKRTRR